MVEWIAEDNFGEMTFPNFNFLELEGEQMLSINDTSR